LIPSENVIGEFHVVKINKSKHMKTIGLIGGLTWHSTLDYYRIINEMANEHLGGVHAAKCVIYSVDFGEIKYHTIREERDKLGDIILGAAQALERAGADCVMIGANTMHYVAHKVEPGINIPLIHVAECVANEIEKKQLKKVVLLGTKYCMRADFYPEILAKHGIEMIIPDNETDIDTINDPIYNEFCLGVFSAATKQKYLDIIDKLIKRGAEGVIFGCTEIPILLKQSDCSIPVFDSTYLHAKAAIDFAMIQ
jgi:aspartate racemase